jgi:putative nucleotidyltransferase with HDIG domain
MESDQILKKLDSIKDLPTLPMIAMEVNRMLNDSRTSINSLSAAIGKDQSIVTKILKIVNSAFYGVPSKVTTVEEAVVRLGFNSVRNIVVSVSVFDALEIKGFETSSFEVKDFWKHSIAVATISRYIAEKTRLQDPDDCFVAGLIHDIGLVILAKYFPDIMIGMMSQVVGDTLTIYEAEKNCIKVRHSKIGEIIAKKWRLPSSLCDTIKYHHSPNKGAINPELVTIVHLGDLVANWFVATSINPKRVLVEPILIGVSDQNAVILRNMFANRDEWFPEVHDKIEEAYSFLVKDKDN